MYGWLNLYLNQGIKMFIFSLTYLKPINEVEKYLPQHIDYLERHYQSSSDFKYLASLLKYIPMKPKHLYILISRRLSELMGLFQQKHEN